MKAEVKYTYDKNEIVEIVIAAHAAVYPPPKETQWAGRMSNYPDQVIVTAVPVNQAETKEDEA